MIFKNRRQAGKSLARHFQSMSLTDPIVLALPRGGVPVGFEIAKELQAPLDVLVVRKVGAPRSPEYGIGAITEGGYYWIDAEAAQAVGASETDIEKTVRKEFQELTRRVSEYRTGKPLPSLSGRSVIVVDDGLATGVTARVACHYLKDQGADQVILAVPVCSPRTSSFLRSEVDEVVCLSEPEFFMSVGQFYEEFEQTSDEEVLSLLKEAKKWEKEPALHPMADSSTVDEEVAITGGEVKLAGHLFIPAGAQGIVVFAHGSGSGRLSPRNQQVSRTLHEAGLGTLLFDLLTPAESLNRANVFDIPLLASRLVLATRWLEGQTPAKDLPLGYFGASTGGGAALWAAAELKDQIKAVVSRGGRPDLAIPKLHQVSAPTLLLVGGWDEPVIEMNQEAMKYLSIAKLTIIPEATHLFEEPGKLEAVSRDATDWFRRHLGGLKQSGKSESARPGLRSSLDPIAHAVRAKAKPLQRKEDLAPLIKEISKSRIVMLGEASHGTHEFYEWRRTISERLIADHGFNFISVEGDWPPSWELSHYARGDAGNNVRKALKSFNRWPTWMWANEEVAGLADWMRIHNQNVSENKRVEFYGLDVYSLFESIDVTLRELNKISPFLARRAKLRYSCFDSFQRDERAYAKSLIEFPKGCEKEVQENLQDLLKFRLDGMQDREEALFDATQNARIIANAEHYYRTMIHADEDSWNVRDRHMLDTLEILLDRHGENSKAIVWAHNTHIGDYRATDMHRQGQINIGGLAREKWGEENVSLVGFGTYQGEVIASHAWDGPTEKMPVPPARPGSLEASLHSVAESLGRSAFFFSLRDPSARSGVLSKTVGHRAIGVVYHPEYERFGNYVPTSLSNRYDAFIFIDETNALEPLTQKFKRKDIPETWPQGL